MRILALSDYMELDSAIEQVHYANSFPGVEVKLRCNMSPYQVEQTLICENYDGIFLSEALSSLSVCSSVHATMWDVLQYQGQDYIGCRADDLMLLYDKALSDWRSGMGVPSQIISRSLWKYRRGEALKKICDLGFPCTLESNSVPAPVNGITVHSESEVVGAMNWLFGVNSRLTEILARRYPRHCEPYTVFVFGNGDFWACWPEISAPYASAYQMRSAAIGVPKLFERLAHCAGTLAHTFSVRDYCKFDFLVDASQRIYFIGIDTAPSLAKIGACAYINALPFCPEQVLALLLLIFAQRTGNCAFDGLSHVFPKILLNQLGF